MRRTLMITLVFTLCEEQIWNSVLLRLIDDLLALDSIPLPFIQDHRGRQIIPKDYFINKDLEYLKGGDLSIRYSTLVIKRKAATYELKWIEDLVYELWSPVVVKYDQHAYLGTSHRVTRLTIIKKYDYDHLEEIEVLRDDEQLYTFKEGVESYQKKLNLTKPDTYRPNLRNKTAYTSHSDPHGIIYVDQFKRKRLMHTDEHHKFSDGTLNDVRTALHDIAVRIRMEYLPMRKWSNLDKKRTRVMVQDIDKQLYQRRLMRNLEMFISGRIYGKDLSF
ncbi:retrovirus-related pol polyprotein from transposon TNT 1-94 [Tanacetum coccineum]